MSLRLTTRNAQLQDQADRAIDAQGEALNAKRLGRLRWTADDADCPDMMRLAALTEELGEVARALHDGDTANLHRELSQIAGVALAWGVALERGS